MNKGISRGDIYFIRGTQGTDFSTSIQRAERPGIIVSNDKCNKFSPVVEVVLLTSARKNTLPTHVDINMSRPSVALCEQIHSVPVNRLGRYMGHVSDDEMDELDQALKISLGLEKISKAFVYAIFWIIAPILLVMAGFGMLDTQAAEYVAGFDVSIVQNAPETTQSDPELILTDEYEESYVDDINSLESQITRSHNGIYEGDFIKGNITHYDICLSCCGKTDGITASGLKIRNGMDDPYIVACNWLPFGSIISINGTEYTVNDRGGVGLNTIGRVDIFVPAGHSEALRLGRIYVTIEIIYINEVE